ncbi:MAG: poly-beta-1,6-N-acetyl-D-glucosamine N-deacetylase PgaB [Nitrospirae bacterium]|nr:poly-beta-1,6-N-acetyl-D-glucosamine N-deacetylase PgaB [Nitrospirota bacterium]
MLKRAAVIIAILILSLNKGYAIEMKPGEFLALCYHSVSERPVPGDNYTVTRQLFTEQMEYLKTHGYTPVSMNDILLASEGKKSLPPKPVLLTFDDAYTSYYEFVVPLLKRFNFPSVLAVVSTFIEKNPEGLPEPLMRWEQIKEVSSGGLVEVVSHSYDLHKGIQYNQPGNVGAAAFVRAYDPVRQKYETEEEYRKRLEADFALQEEIFVKKLGFKPNAIVWPYGRYNSIGIDAARKNGYRMAFNFDDDGFGNLGNLMEVKRLVVENKSIKDFISKINDPGHNDTKIRAVQVDLDLIFDPDAYEQTDKNLGRLIERLVEMKINTVFLQAFADPEGTGNIKSVYFHNRVLPVRGDIFSHAAHQIFIRGIRVYAWMPALSIVLPDEKLNNELRVQELSEDGVSPSSSWYKRLTPFSAKTKEIMRTLYEDLAAYSIVDGVLFQDDAYLNDMEDFHPLAMLDYERRFGRKISLQDVKDNTELSQKWSRYKTGVLLDFTKGLMEGVRRHRPGTKSARNLYANTLANPQSEAWFAQNYGLSLQAYDKVIIMAYPQMEDVDRHSGWLERLVHNALEFPEGLNKTIFKIQTYDWKNKEWIKDGIILKELRTILASGGMHIAYYPDNFYENKPSLKSVRLEMSTQTNPFLIKEAVPR